MAFEQTEVKLSSQPKSGSHGKNTTPRAQCELLVFVLPLLCVLFLSHMLPNILRIFLIYGHIYVQVFNPIWPMQQHSSACVATCQNAAHIIAVLSTAGFCFYLYVQPQNDFMGGNKQSAEAGPGSYKSRSATGRQIESYRRTMPSTAFSLAPLPDPADKTLSPGYDITNFLCHCILFMHVHV